MIMFNSKPIFMKRTILLIAFLGSISSMIFAQTVLIKGTVTSSDDGISMPGVSIEVKGTTIGQATDADGNYSISVPASAEALIFSFVGYLSQEIPINGRTTIDVVLNPDIYSMEEVVVIGYGTQRKREVTGAISQVRGDEIAMRASPSFEGQLAGKAAGVQITTQTGVLGESPRFRIRGVGSITSGTYPLIVVDGIPIFTGEGAGYADANSLGDINPSDIESLEILKDGSATAIYGSRAANGVLLITTKRGKKGNAKVDYNTYMGVASPVNLFDLLHTDDFITINNEKRTNMGQSPIAAGTEYDTDWQSAVLRKNAFQQDHNLALSGATEGTNYYFSLGYTKQEGVTKPNEMSRFTARANLDQKVKEWLTIGTNMGFTQSTYYGLNTGANSLSGNIFSAIRQLPNTPVYDANDPSGYNFDDTNPNLVGKWDNLSTIGDNIPNIVYVLDNNVQNTKVLRTIGNAYARVDMLPYLNYKLQLSVDNIATEGFLYWNPTHGDGFSSNGRIQNRFNNSVRWNLQHIVSFDKTFGGSHNLSMVLVNEYQFQRRNEFFAIGTDLSNEFFNQNLITDSYSVHGTGGNLTENGFISYAARLNYNFSQRYFIQASVRRDAISSLPESNRYGIFPGASLGWNVAGEPFMENLTHIISDFKVRASYAQVGNVSIGNYPYLGLYNSATYGPYNGIAFSQSGNNDLLWETSKKIDFGFDAAFAEGRYKFSFDYYMNDQDGLILDAPTPPSMGIPNNSITQNIGQLKNWGYEFSADAVVISKKDLRLSVNANLTLAQNEVVALVEGQDIIDNPYNIIREGESFRALYGFEYWGTNPANGNPVHVMADGRLVQTDVFTGDVTTFDPANPAAVGDEDGMSADKDRKLLGPSIPTYFGAVNISGDYKGFDLGVMLRFSGGNYIMNVTRSQLNGQNFINNGKEILGRWQSVDEPGDGWTPRLAFQQDANTNLTGYTSGRFVEKADFLKVQNITLGYTLPKPILDKIGVNRLRVYVQAQDFFMVTNYSGIDPEMEVNGVDNNGTPRQRVFTFGLNLSL